jgi:predicted secreted acid phosphatase
VIENKIPNVSVVIDIDETMISLQRTINKFDDGWFDESLAEIMVTTNYPAFPCVIDFVNLCMARNIKVYVLSSRRKKYTQYAKELLANAGYAQYTDLLLRDDDDHGTIQNYKIMQRKALVEKGEHILINIGDQDSDLVGGYADHEKKFPNDWYEITQDMVEMGRSKCAQ